MFFLIANLLFEVMALIATWPRRFLWLRIFLIYLILSDTACSFIPSRDFIYWYYYWICRSIGMLCQTFLIDELVTKKVKRLQIFPFSITITCILCVIYAWLYGLIMKGKFTYGLTDKRMMTMLIVIAVLNLASSTVALLLTKEYIVCAGLILWALANIVSNHYLFNITWLFSVLSLIPLLVWISPLLTNRLIVHSRKRKGYKPTESMKSGGYNLVESTKSVH